MSFLPPYAAQSSLLAVVADPALRSAVATSLARGLGVTVEQAPDVPSAMALLARTAFALVIVDQSLPGEHVPSFIRAIRSQYGDMPVMALVDRVGPEQMADLMQAGVTTVVEKPVSAERLMLRVADVLGPRVPTQSPTEQFNEHLTLAWQAMSNRQLDVASAHARRALALNGSRPEPFNLLGMIAQLRNDVAQAQSYYRTALALNSHYDPARQNLAMLTATPISG
ncbi:MAG: response regulator [Rhodothermales bacterium]|nr:response regulator [Rhodothermales bacterium]